MTKEYKNNITQINDLKFEDRTEVISENSDGFTDVGNAKLFVKLYGSVLRYIEDTKKWIHWTGKVWENVGEEVKITWFAEQTVEELVFQASKLKGTSSIKMLEHANRSSAVSRISAMVTLAKADPRIAIKSSKLNSHLNLFNLNNGTFDLNTGKLRSHSPEDLITKVLNFDFDKNALAPTFMKSVHQWTGGNQQLMEALGIIFGMMLYGGNPFQIFIMLIGSGGTGKTTFVRIIQDTFGPYAGDMQADSLYSFKYEKNTADIAQSIGKRFVYIAELNDEKEIDAGILKRITGGDKVKARELYNNFGTFIPEFTLVISSNHLPIFHRYDDAVDRRLVVIPFNKKLHPDNFDHDLDKKLIREKSGIFNWLLEGFIKGKNLGSQLPPGLTRGMPKEAIIRPPFDFFLDTACNISPNLCTSFKTLYEEYCSVCESRGENKISSKAFSLKLKKIQGLKKETKKGGNIYWFGIGLISNEDDGDDCDGF